MSEHAPSSRRVHAWLPRLRRRKLVPFAALLCAVTLMCGVLPASADSNGDVAGALRVVVREFSREHLHLTKSEKSCFTRQLEKNRGLTAKINRAGGFDFLSSSTTVDVIKLAVTCAPRQIGRVIAAPIATSSNIELTDDEATCIAEQLGKIDRSVLKQLVKGGPSGRGLKRSQKTALAIQFLGCAPGSFGREFVKEFFSSAGLTGANISLSDAQYECVGNGITGIGPDALASVSQTRDADTIVKVLQVMNGCAPDLTKQVFAQQFTKVGAPQPAADCIAGRILASADLLREVVVAGINGGAGTPSPALSTAIRECR